MVMGFIKRVACKIFGHNYPSSCFSGNALYFCVRCGKELLDRTFDDLSDMEPMSDEELDEMMINDG